MKTTVTKEKGQATVTGSISADEMEQHFQSAAREASEGMTVKGFRPGSIPYETVVKSVGEDAILKGAVTKSLKWALPRIYDENGIEPIDEPQVTVKKIAKNNPFEFEIVVPVLPDVVLPPLDNLSAERQSAKVIDEEVSHAMQHLQNSRAKSVTVNRSAKKGDRVEVDFVIRADGVKIEDGESKNHPIMLGQGKYVPGFEEQLEGMSAGETKEFDINVPGDYNDKRIAGRAIHSVVTMHIVQEQEIPELDDAFASSLGSFKKLDDLRESVSKGLQDEKEKKEDHRVRITLIEDVAKRMESDVPPLLVERELDAMTDEFEKSISGFGVSLDDYLKHLKKTKKELIDGWKDEAKKRVRIGLALHAIAEDQKIVPDPAKVQERVNETLKQYGGIKEAKEKVDIERLTAYTKSVLTNEEVFDYLEKKATIKNKN